MLNFWKFIRTKKGLQKFKKKTQIMTGYHTAQIRLKFNVNVSNWARKIEVFETHLSHFYLLCNLI